MINHRWRPVLYSALGILAVWVLAMTGYTAAKNAIITAEKVKAYAESVNLGQLKGDARTRAILKLEDMLNALSYEERQRVQLDRTSWSLLAQMTEGEKAAFIEATLPTGFKQMLAAFAQMPEDRRRKTIDDTLRRLLAARNKNLAGDTGGSADTNAPVLSSELQSKILALDLTTFYSQSSAQTKAELAPMLEEMQRVMESGRPLRRR
jgi:hypothetical protein